MWIIILFNCWLCCVQHIMSIGWRQSLMRMWHHKTFANIHCLIKTLHIEFKLNFTVVNANLYELDDKWQLTIVCMHTQYTPCIVHYTLPTHTISILDTSHISFDFIISFFVGFFRDFGRGICVKRKIRHRWKCNKREKKNANENSCHARERAVFSITHGEEGRKKYCTK